MAARPARAVLPLMTCESPGGWPEIRLAAPPRGRSLGRRGTIPPRASRLGRQRTCRRESGPASPARKTPGTWPARRSSSATSPSPACGRSCSLEAVSPTPASGRSPSLQRPSPPAALERSGIAVRWSAGLARSFSLQTLWFTVHDLALRYSLQLSQCLTHAPDVVAMLGSELPPMRSHFFNDWIITHHLHPLVLPTSTAPGRPSQNRTPHQSPSCAYWRC